MVQRSLPTKHFAWSLPASVAACAVLTLFPLTLEGSDASAFMYLFVTLPAVSLILLLLARRRQARQRVAPLMTYAAFLIFTIIFFSHFSAMRDTTRWLLYSKRFQAEVLAQSPPANGLLRHIEWESWGFPGAGDTVVNLVYDPSDSLPTAPRPESAGSLNGLPCPVYRIHRLQPKWYTVHFYTDTDWDHCE